MTRSPPHPAARKRGRHARPDAATTARLEAEAFVAGWPAAAERLAREGLYDPADEHEACGVGLVAAIDGKPRRSVVEAGIAALKAVWHRGAVDADGKTGDGAGIHVQIAQDFFRTHVQRTGHRPDERRIAIGMVFLPRTDLTAQERCRSIVETEILRDGYEIYGWRQVPVNVAVLGDKANATRPEIEQIMIANNKGQDEPAFELDLYLIRRRIEKAALAQNIGDFYICSLSGRSVIYKGMVLAEQLATFYPDLLDERFQSNFAIFHQRYSTNTFPAWRQAQPFRVLAHNGEINTLRGNINWMRCHEPRMASPLFGPRIEDVKPVVQPGGSDSAIMDNVYELMVRTDRELPMAHIMMMPDAWSYKTDMEQAHKDLYAYTNAVMEPWDGPAALCSFGGKWVMASMDRHGLRPMRYALTQDGLLFVGSETGMVRLEETAIIEKGRVGPGQMLAVNLSEGRLYRDREIKDRLAARQPFGDWVKTIRQIDALIDPDVRPRIEPTGDALLRRQSAGGWTMEDLETVLQPMAEDGKEAVGSMGDDGPIAVLASRYRGLHPFFRQNFSQVTNPPIDSLRERNAMSIKTRLGNLGNILDEDESQCHLLQLESPVLLTAEFDAMRSYMGETAREVDCTFDAAGAGTADADSAGAGKNKRRATRAREGLAAAIERIRLEAEQAVREGCEHVVLSDRAVGASRVAIPMILATAAVHTHLTRQSLRTFTSLNVRAGECLDVHSIAVLIGVGATTVNPYLAEATIADRHRRGLFGKDTLEICLARYKKAADDGLLKVMSKMGISVVSSYRGGHNFEAVGLSRALVEEFFPGMPSRISGMGLTGIERRVLAAHLKAYDEAAVPLPVGGYYRARHGQEAHAFDGRLIHILQTAVATDSFRTYKAYAEGVRKLAPVTLRDLCGLIPAGPPVSIDEVDSITAIRKRFVTGAMSLGALSREAHETLAIAMNRIGAQSNSGEGGETSERFRPRKNGDNANSSIKQVASGRFGVTAEYLNNCREIEIKVAQGAKPGEGGQLAGNKVTVELAALRHSTPGVPLISPPPHHDIYSIEDLAQLIYDLKQINPEARVSVKLVARAGIGTIAAGVAKAKADVISIAGHSGGTGAAPLSSLKYAGVPWEMGLSEVHQVLSLNRLRHRVRLRVDGGIKTGRDVVIAALLGAEEFGIGTAALVAMGCIMVRQCHSNTCPVGVCTQDEALRQRFGGTPEKVVNLFSFIAEDVREILASLGARTLNEITGRTDLLFQESRGSSDLDDLDLNPLLTKADSGDTPNHCTLTTRNEVPDTLDAEVLADAHAALEEGEKMQLTYTVRNTQRTVGARLSSVLTRRYGMTGLAPDQITLRLRGSAGQSLGAFLVQGVKLEVFGDANDYVGKGLSGGTIVVRPPVSATRLSQANVIIGNTALYGATEGSLFAAGLAGERFAVRNSGASAVVEGCGANGCEYMTNGTVVILGTVGHNFAAGMTGGMAFVFDPDDQFAHRVNDDAVVWQRIRSEHWAEVARALIARHVAETRSVYAEDLLRRWDLNCQKMWQIAPKEMLDKLSHPLQDVAPALMPAAGED
jgi:glutamate synthase (NADPH/NADH) large chain